jgi:hypothetical protein
MPWQTRHTSAAARSAHYDVRLALALTGSIELVLAA